MRRLAIVIPTYNREASLERTLQSLGACRGTTAGDVIVVDNNSTDRTPEVVALCDPSVRYIQERRQGLSHARNTGIEAARGLGAEIVAFIDDDVEATPGWADALLRAFDDHPEADCVGGRVLPANLEALPPWLTPEHWGPLALQDHGPDPLIFHAAAPRGLIGANFAFRLRVFEQLGEFSPAVQRVKDGIGSTEDHEMLNRLYQAGRKAVYVPDVVVMTHVPPERMRYDYHRRWHLGHGRFTARMRLAVMEQTSHGRIFGVPAYLFRSAASDAIEWLRLSAGRNRTKAFEAETRLWFFSGFLKERACVPRR